MGRIFFDILGPVLLLVAAGFAGARRVGLQAATLSKLAYWILGPAFMFDVLASAELDVGLVIRTMAAALGAVVGGAVVMWVLARFSGMGPGETAAGVTTSVYGNVGNFGLAIVAFTFGEGALPLAGLMLLTINTAGLVIGVASATARKASPPGVVRTALLAPMVLAVWPAVAVNVADVSLPLAIDRAVSLLAAAMIPVMLVMLGVQLAGMTRPRLGRVVTLPVTVKLVVTPLLAVGGVRLLGLSGLAAGVVVLQSAMPTAVFAALLAVEHDFEPDLVATTVVVGTVASLATLPVVISLVS